MIFSYRPHAVFDARDYPSIRAQPVAPYSLTVWRRVSHRALRFGPPACGGERGGRPGWGGGPFLAAAISCCVLPVANARTWSPRFDELRLPPTAFAVVVGGRPRRRAGAAVFVAVTDVLAEAVCFSCVPLL